MDYSATNKREHSVMLIPDLAGLRENVMALPSVVGSIHQRW